MYILFNMYPYLKILSRDIVALSTHISLGCLMSIKM